MKNKSLWFKQVYVEDILAGVKSDTYRKPTEVAHVGQPLVFSVGPRPPFARGIVTEVRDERPEELAPERLATLIRFYGVQPFYRRIVWQLV